MAGNQSEQFGEIYDQYIDKIYRFVYLKVNSLEIAEDITSKVFLRGWEAYEKSQIQNPGAFLYQIARNAVIDHYREKGRTKTIFQDAVPEAIDPGLDLHAKAVFSSDVDIVKQALQKLKKEHQDIIIWHYLEDMPIAEIAKLTGRPAGTIRVMLHRGLKELKDFVTKQPWQSS